MLVLNLVPFPNPIIWLDGELDIVWEIRKLSRPLEKLRGILIMVFFPKYILKFLFGNDYIGGSVVLSILVSAYFLNVIKTSLQSFFVSHLLQIYHMRQLLL